MGERQAKGNEKNQCLKGWETLDYYLLFFVIYSNNVFRFGFIVYPLLVPL